MSRLLAISVASTRKGEIQILDEVEAHIHQGLEGDRFRDYSANAEKPNLAAVTFVEIEKLRDYEHEFKKVISHEDIRRNLLTEGVDLNALVDQEFSVGEVIFKGTEWCEPCAYLARRTQHEILKGLLHKGGLRAQILKGGTIRKGDLIALVK